MSALLKEVLALTAKSEAAVWKAVEQKVLAGLPSLATADVVNIAKHFGVAKQGTNDLWQHLDSAAVAAFPTLNAEQTLSLISGFGEAPEAYQLSKQLDNLLTVSWNQLGKVALQKKQEQDPYYVSKIMNVFNANGPTWFKMAQTQDFSRDLNELEIPPSGDSISYDITPKEGTQLRTPAEREAFIQKELENLTKAFPNNAALDQIRSN